MGIKRGERERWALIQRVFVSFFGCVHDPLAERRESSFFWRWKKEEGEKEEARGKSMSDDRLSLCLLPNRVSASRMRKDALPPSSGSASAAGGVEP